MPDRVLASASASASAAAARVPVEFPELELQSVDGIDTQESGRSEIASHSGKACSAFPTYGDGSSGSSKAAAMHGSINSSGSSYMVGHDSSFRTQLKQVGMQLGMPESVLADLNTGMRSSMSNDPSTIYRFGSFT